MLPLPLMDSSGLTRMALPRPSLGARPKKKKKLIHPLSLLISSCLTRPPGTLVWGNYTPSFLASLSSSGQFLECQAKKDEAPLP